MSYIGKLERKSNHIDFDGSGRFSLAPGFVPPLIGMEPSISTGTSASAYAGATKDGENMQPVSVSVPFHTTGSSYAHIRGGLSDINNFLRSAGDETDPVYFSFSPEGTPQPTWGQSVRRLRIIAGSATYGDTYGVSDMASRAVPNCTLNLTVAAIDGVTQPAAMASGGVFDDKVQWSDGIPRGVCIPSASGTGGNLFTNPVFGTGVTTGWTIDANITAKVNALKEYALFSPYSILATSHAAASSKVTQSATLTAATYTLSGYFKIPGGGAVTESHVKLWYDAASVSATIYPFGDDGWYVFYANVNGTAAAYIAGFQVQEGQSVYCGGMQLAINSTFTELFNGDMLGCAWGGTAHASASSRVAGNLYLPFSQINRGRGSVSVVWTPLRASGATNRIIFHATGMGTGFYLRWQGAGLVWQFLSGATNLTSSATSFPANTPICIHATWGPGGMNIYINGVNVATTATYTPDTGGTNFYIGSSGSADWAGGVFNNFKIYDVELSASQVLEDYNELAPLMAAKLPMPSPIPWLWTIGGDGDIDDITDATHAAYAVAGGLAGDIPSASVYYALKRSSAGTGLNVLLSTYDSETYIPHEQMYETKTTSTTTSDVTLAEWTLTRDAWIGLAGKMVYAFIEIIDATSDQTLTAYMSIVSGNTMGNTERATLDVSSSIYRQFEFYGLVVPEYMQLEDDLMIDNRVLTISIIGKKTAGGATNLTVHGELMFENALYTDRETTDTEHRITGRTAIGHTVSSGALVSCKVEPVIGSIAYLYPGMVNYLFASEFTFYTAPWLSQQIIYLGYTPSYMIA